MKENGAGLGEGLCSPPYRAPLPTGPAPLWGWACAADRALALRATSQGAGPRERPVGKRSLEGEPTALRTLRALSLAPPAGWVTLSKSLSLRLHRRVRTRLPRLRRALTATLERWHSQAQVSECTSIRSTSAGGTAAPSTLHSVSVLGQRPAAQPALVPWEVREQPRPFPASGSEARRFLTLCPTVPGPRPVTELVCRQPARCLLPLEPWAPTHGSAHRSGGHTGPRAGGGRGHRLTGSLLVRKGAPTKGNHEDRVREEAGEQLADCSGSRASGGSHLLSPCPQALPGASRVTSGGG